MAYFINHLDIILAIFGMILVVVAPEKQKKIGITFVVIASILLIIGAFSDNSKEQEPIDPSEESEQTIVSEDAQNTNSPSEENELTTNSAAIQEEDDPVSEEVLVNEDVSITDDTFEYGNRGMASLYRDTSREMPTWFEGDLDDVCLSFIVDNTGTSYANIKHTKLIIDEYEPVSMEDILLLSEESHAGAISEVEGDVDLINISPNRSEYDVNFFMYNDNDEGIEIELREGQTFNVDQVSQTRFVIYPKLAKSGIYTYHLKVDYEYYREDYSMVTEPVSFIYIAGDSNDYEYDNSELASLHLDREYYSEENDMIIYYTIEGRTLRIHDTRIIPYDNNFGRYFSLINTVIVENGTNRIDAYAFGDEPGLYKVTKMYLPKSLDYLDVDCFYMSGDSLQTIYFGGTEEQWDSLIANSESDRIENLEGVDIICNYEY